MPIVRVKTVNTQVTSLIRSRTVSPTAGYGTPSGHSLRVNMTSGDDTSIQIFMGSPLVKLICVRAISVVTKRAARPLFRGATNSFLRVALCLPGVRAPGRHFFD